ncbi:hypothetical protein [Tissierella sp. Yu-01]|uniref:hypothetical protein n=1 Tax=Tissierella sp. Yu-01 TaxID=3035694 RepID=UPI00240D1C26|nr:hypothetical protein [Tissierella sp. Yu-01]WFA09517.1 hypothetical protein P3962_02900 [Tissierella sp. Yu-01]
MAKIEKAIIKILKEELEFTNKGTNYSQWVLGVNINKISAKDKVTGNPIYIARVVVKTSDSPYVDGMDIVFMAPEEDIIIEAKYYEKTPEFQGGTVEDSIEWLMKMNGIYYLQLDNPFEKAD